MYGKSFFFIESWSTVSNVLFIIFSFTLMGVAKWYLGNFGPQKKMIWSWIASSLNPPIFAFCQPCIHCRIEPNIFVNYLEICLGHFALSTMHDKYKHILALDRFTDLKGFSLVWANWWIFSWLHLMNSSSQPS